MKLEEFFFTQFGRLSRVLDWKTWRSWCKFEKVVRGTRRKRIDEKSKHAEEWKWCTQIMQDTQNRGEGEINIHKFTKKESKMLQHKHVLCTVVLQKVQKVLWILCKKTFLTDDPGKQVESQVIHCIGSWFRLARGQLLFLRLITT
jgi:hypothetical protein